MFEITSPLPDVVPVLSRGRHRNPRKGACFMEMASFLAGERWSDHPACTHPLLAELARGVNDCTSDEARARLGTLIPSVIGLTGDDLHVDARIGMRAAITALPVSAAARQNVLAVSLLTCDRVLADIDGRAADDLLGETQEALARVPQAASWAQDFARRLRVSPKGFRRHAAPSIVRHAVEGIAQSCVDDPDRMLFDLLSDTIEECRELMVTAPLASVEATRWVAACELSNGGKR